MRRALQLAELAIGYTAPNPMVGCVLVKDDKIIGEGYHKAYGEAHAEVNAIDAIAEGQSAEGCSVYVTLEPCAHHGKTAPCTELLIRNKVKEVFVGTTDSNPLVSGGGVERLKRAGIQVHVGLLETECRILNKRFFTFYEKNRPYVVLKWAQTKDGYLDRQRESEEIGINWISAPETKTLVHKWRSEEQAILVGRNTIINDNPSLTVRQYYGKNPLRVVIDSQLQITENSKQVFSEDAPTLIFNRVKDHQENNVTWVKIPETSTKCVLDHLYKRGIQSIMVEGGSRTLQYFIVDNVWDEAHVIVGDVKFDNGVKAPIINKIPSNTYTFGSDRIYHFERL